MRAVFGHAIERPGKTAPKAIGVGFKAPNELALPTSSKPDPRLVALVRILARQAARDFYSRPMGRPGLCGLASLTLFDDKDDRIARQRSVPLPNIKEYAIVAVCPTRLCIPQLVAGDLNIRKQVIDFARATVRS